MDKEFGELKAEYIAASKENNVSLKEELVSKMIDNLRKRNNGNDYVQNNIENKTFCLDTTEVTVLYEVDGLLSRLTTSQKGENIAKQMRQKYGLEK